MTIKHFFYFAFIYLLYRVKYIDRPDGEKGYFIVKRHWVWLLLFPLIAVLAILKAIYYSFLDIFDYDICYTQGEKRKLSFKEKLAMTDRLLL
jgi:hypothetical protein